MPPFRHISIEFETTPPGQEGRLLGYAGVEGRKSFQLAQQFKIPREHLDSAGGLLPIKVFVWSVVTVLRQAEAKKHDWSLEVFLHRDNGANRSAFPHPCRFFPKRSPHGFLRCFSVRSGFWTEERLEE